MQVTKNWMKSILLVTLFVGPIAESQAAQSRLSILYTNAARDRNGGDGQIRSRLSARVRTANRTSRQSRANFSLRHMRSRRIGYRERRLTLLGNLNDLRGGGSTQNERSLRNDARREERDQRSDLVAVITTERGGGGVPRASGWASRPGFYSAVNADYLGNRPALPHELGHNFNGVHGQAHRLSNGLHTAMWADGTRSWTQYFSNPSVRRSGIVTGTRSKNNAARMRGRDRANANRF